MGKRSDTLPVESLYIDSKELQLKHIQPMPEKVRHG
jgi:hypothetical protein